MEEHAHARERDARAAESRGARDAAAARWRGLAPGGGVGGALALEGSKSLAQRALLAASLARGRTRLARVPAAADVRAARDLVAAVGARVETLAPAALALEGRPPGPHGGWACAEPLLLGESGTLARLASAAAALCGRTGTTLELVAQGSLAQRSSAPLFAALREAGAGLASLGAVPDGWPVRIEPIGPPSRLVLRAPRSSQELSALLLAAAAWPDEIALAVEGELPSRPYVELTRALLARFGARVALEREEPARALYLVRGPLRAPAEPLVLEPDASSAAVALAAAALSGGELRVPGLGRDALQGDVRIVEHLAAFGVEARAEPDALLARGAPRWGARLALGGEPDLAPVLAAVAGAVALRARRGELALDAEAATSVLSGLETLPRKESSRIAVLARGLRALGLAVEESDAHLAVAPGAGPLPQGPLELDSAGDHRMAFAFALLGLVREDVRVLEPDCVAKSWPGFWRDLERVGARVVHAPARARRA